MGPSQPLMGPSQPLSSVPGELREEANRLEVLTGISADRLNGRMCRMNRKEVRSGFGASGLGGAIHGDEQNESLEPQRHG